jgi:signal transduction histidine kinase/CheY-like chemotaxis protein
VKVLLALGILLAQLIGGPVGAASAIVPSALTVQPQVDQQDLTPAALQWYDASGERTLADWQQRINATAVPAAAGLSAAGFAWLEVAQLPLGRREGALWLAVPLHNPQSALLRHLVVTPPRLERIDAWLLTDPLNAVPLSLGHSGLAVPLAERPMAVSNPAWPLTMPPGASTLVLRIQSRTPLAPQLSLWSPAAHALEARQLDLRHGLEAGALALAALLSLVFALWLRESTWAWYGAASISLLLYQACFTGMALLWLWPAHPQWTLPVLSAALAGAHLSWAMFFLRFTPVGSQLSWLRVGALGLAGLSLLGLLLVLLRGYGAGIGLQELAGLLLPLVLPWLAWRAWRQGEPAARFLLLSYGMLAVASMLRVAVVRGWLAPAPWLENWFFPLSTVLTSAVMMLALAERLRVLGRQQVRQARQHQETLQTRIQEATVELVQAHDVAQAAVQFKTRFVARVSHDLRTPLHTLLGHAALVQRYVDQLALANSKTNQKRVLDSVQAMQRSGHDMLQLSDELLELVRGEAGRLTLKTAPCHLPSLAQELIESSRWLAQQGGNQLQLTLELARPDLLLDAARLQQVLRNLLTNACAATQGGVITLGLRSAAGADAQTAQLELWVQDSGRGIPAQALERIFEPFEQLGTDSATGSAGLGLAIARQWVRLMGSDLAVQSALGVGSVFSWVMQVPVARLAAQAPLPDAALPAPLSTGTPAAPELPLHGHVLVVDDVEDMRLCLQDLLELTGLQVSQASSGQAAIAVLQGPTDAGVAGIDLVLTDQNMPDGDGRFLLQWCRQHRPGLAVVCLSGEPQPPGLFDAALLKPASAEQLHQVLQNLLPPSLDWAALRALADSGDGLGVDAWIAQHRDQLGAGPLARGVVALGGSLQLAALVRWLSRS